MNALSGANTLLLAVACSVAGFLATPAFAMAAGETNIKTQQLLPPGGTSCTPIIVTNVTPFIYNGELHSFEATISDTSYVAVLGTVGNTSIPLNHMIRMGTTTNSLRIHADIDSMAVGNGLPVSITLLSGANGRTCLSTVTFTVTGTGTSAPGIPTGPAYIPPTNNPQSGVGTGVTSGGFAAPTAPSTPTTPTAPTTPVVGTSTDTGVGGTCTPESAYRLWFVLVVLYIALVALLALAQPPLYLRHMALPAALILVPFAFLIGFWFFSVSCRGSNWVPVLLVITAIAGLIAAYRERLALERRLWWSR